MVSKNSKNDTPSAKEKKYDTIPFRLDFIKKLLDGKKLKPMIDIDNNDTEYFTNPSKYYEVDENRSYDTRKVLNKKIHDFYKIINQIGGLLRYIKSGTTGHTFKAIVKDDDGVCVNYAVKVAAYPKKERYGGINDLKRPENAELMMIRLLSYFVVKKQTPHIVLPIGTFNTSIKPFVNLINENVVQEDNSKYLEFVERYENDELYDQVSILISEWANRGDLLDFIRKNATEFKLRHWKVFFFQVISVLAVIQSKFPSFRHNDMKANNVLVHKIGKRNTLFSYTVNQHVYIVPIIGYQIKLWDFDFACIPGVVNNAKVNSSWTTELNIVPVKNRYYDMHYFFNTLIKKGFFPELMTADWVDQEVKDFINRVVPPKYQKHGRYVAKRGRILIDDEYLTPDEVLRNDPFFEEFRSGIHHKKSRKKRRKRS